MKLPELGVGLVCLPGLERLAGNLAHSIDVVEIEPQTYWTHALAAEGGQRGFRVDPDRFSAALGLGRPILAHSVGCPVGGSRPPHPAQLAALRESFELLKPLWWSDHMSFLAAPDGEGWRNVGFLMPPCQTVASVEPIVDRIKTLQDAFGLPFAFETGVNYLRPREFELSDGDFWGEIADRAACGILLDAHNVWANGRNGRAGLCAVAGRLPLERVWEIHVADGQWHNGYWLDAHSGPPCDELLNEVAALVPQLPGLRAILLEMIPDYVEARAIGEGAVADALARLNAIWKTRGSCVSAPGRQLRALFGRFPDSPSPEQWETRLCDALRPGPPESAADPGLAVYGDLIAMVRRGTLVETLPLSLRFLFRTLGAEGVDALMARFWAAFPPEAFMSDEAERFASFAASEAAVPHIDEVLAFEIAAHRAAMTAESQIVSFTCEPEPLLLALKHGDRIDPRPCPRVEVEVTPPKGAEPLSGAAAAA